MRPLVWCLALLSAAGCALGPSGGDARARQRFYLTTESVQGNKAIDACARGYHMASRFELAELSTLHYDPHLGVTADDSGSGPPSHAAGYGSQDPTGWVRTGGASRFADTTDRKGSAFTNCAAWSTNSSGAFGTIAFLNDRFTAEDGSPVPLWNGGSERCDVSHHVWCIEDRASDQAAASEEEPPRRHHRGM
jgi:hypothetical protein